MAVRSLCLLCAILSTETALFMDRSRHFILLSMKRWLLVDGNAKQPGFSVEHDLTLFSDTNDRLPEDRVTRTTCRQHRHRKIGQFLRDDGPKRHFRAKNSHRHRKTKLFFCDDIILAPKATVSHEQLPDSKKVLTRSATLTGPYYSCKSCPSPLTSKNKHFLLLGWRKCPC